MQKTTMINQEPAIKLEERPIYESNQPTQTRESNPHRKSDWLVALLIGAPIGIGVGYLCSRQFENWGNELGAWNKERIASNQQRERVKQERRNEERAIKKRQDTFITGALYILPPSGESRTYNIESGSNVVVSNKYNSKLILELDGEVLFKSDRGFFLPHFNSLDELYLKKGDKWEPFEYRDQAAWQKRYENLVLELYKARWIDESSYKKSFDEKLKK